MSLTPKRSLSTFDVAFITVGIVVGVGIFRAPSEVALHASSPAWFMALWALGGIIALCGALTYAELATRYPNIGGEFHFLKLAYGSNISFMFIWARISIMQTGALATVAFVFGDYAQNILPLGPEGSALDGAQGSALWAGLVILALTLYNLAGLQNTRRLQLILESLALLAVVAVIVIGLSLPGAPAVHTPALMETPVSTASGADGLNLSALGLALVFVLLTYGGWNEAAYLSAEVKDAHKSMTRALIIAIVLIVVLYLAINYAYLHALGLEGLRESKTPAASVLERAFGPTGGILLSIGICLAALSTINVTILTGARAMCALGQFSPPLAKLGTWQDQTSVPQMALLVQGAISLVLVGFGAFTNDGFSAMVAFSAPAFWLFLLLTGIALFILRYRETGNTPSSSGRFRVPLYPLTPALFCLSCGYMLWSSFGYVRFVFNSGDTQRLSGLAGLGVLALGIPLLLWLKKRAQA